MQWLLDGGLICGTNLENTSMNILVVPTVGIFYNLVPRINTSLITEMSTWWQNEDLILVNSRTLNTTGYEKTYNNTYVVNIAIPTQIHYQ